MGGIAAPRRRRPLRRRRGHLLDLPLLHDAAAESTKLSLKWSFTVTNTIPVSTVTGDDEDAWSLDLEWAFLIDLEPADDVEGDP